MFRICFLDKQASDTAPQDLVKETPWTGALGFS